MSNVHKNGWIYFQEKNCPLSKFAPENGKPAVRVTGMHFPPCQGQQNRTRKCKYTKWNFSMINFAKSLTIMQLLLILKITINFSYLMHWQISFAPCQEGETNKWKSTKHNSHRYRYSSLAIWVKTIAYKSHRRWLLLYKRDSKHLWNLKPLKSWQ